MNKYKVRFENGETTTIEADRYSSIRAGKLNFYRSEKKKCSCGCDCEWQHIVATFPANVVSVWLIELNMS